MPSDAIRLTLPDKAHGFRVPNVEGWHGFWVTPPQAAESWRQHASLTANTGQTGNDLAAAQ